MIDYLIQIVRMQKREVPVKKSLIETIMADEVVDISNGPGDTTVTEFATYEDYLDSQITPLDLYYLEVRYSSYIYYIYKQ